MNKRNHFIDLAKGISIIMVLITHYSWTNTERMRYFFPYWISMAVPIFMLVTGYNFAASCFKKNITTLKEGYALILLKKRIISYTIPFLWMYLVELLIRFARGERYTITEILESFFRGGMGKYGTYYYPVLLQLVFLCPLIYYVVKKWRYGIVLCFLFNLCLEIGKVMIDIERADYRLLAIRYLFAVAMGCYLCIYQKQELNWKWAVLWGIGVFYIWLVSYTDYKPRIFYFWKNTIMLTVFYITPIYLLCQKLLKQVRCKWLEEVGKASYHIFLVQIIYYNYVKPEIKIEIRSLEMLFGVGIGLFFGYGYYWLYGKVRERIRQS